jgi:hypothetical protein
MPDADNASTTNTTPWWRLLATSLVFLLTAALSLGWFVYAVLLIGGEGDNVTCGCWADDSTSPLALLQFLIAALGGASLTTAGALCFKHRRAALVSLALFLAAAVAWVLIFLPTRHMVEH